MRVPRGQQRELDAAACPGVPQLGREVRALGINPLDDRVNPHGSGIAIGHPLGMTGRLRIISRPTDAIGQASDPVLTRDPGSVTVQLAMHAEHLWSVSEGRPLLRSHGAHPALIPTVMGWTAGHYCWRLE